MNYFGAICSTLVVGLGQIVKGKTKKGIKLLLTFYLVLPALVYLSLLINAQFFLYVLASAITAGIILWLYSVGEALLR